MGPEIDSALGVDTFVGNLKKINLYVFFSKFKNSKRPFDRGIAGLRPASNRNLFRQSVNFLFNILRFLL